MVNFTNPLTKSLYLDKLKNVKDEKQSFKGVPPSKKNIFFSMAEDVLFLEEVIYHLNDIGASASYLIEMKDHFSYAARAANSGFGYISLVVAAIDFIRIPAIYIASAALGREVPFKLTNAARWGYSAVILGLTIAAIAAPVVAPFLSVAIAAAFFAVNVVALGRFFYKRAQKRRELAQLTKENGDIDTAEKELKEIQQKADLLMEKINKKENITDQEQIEVNNLAADFEDKKAEIQKLFDRKTKLEVTLEKSIGKAINKGIAIVLSAAILTGFALSLVFPPVGLAVIITASAATAVFVAGHLALPLLKKTRFGAWVSSLFSSKKQADQETENKPANTAEPALEEVHEKTIDIMRQLFKSDQKDALRKLVMDMRKMEALDSHFTYIVEKQDEKAAVLFFNKLAFKANKYCLTEDDAKGFFQQLNSFEEGKRLLKKGLIKLQSGEISLDIPELFSNPVLVKALELEQYRSPKGETASKESVVSSPIKDEDGDGKGENGEEKIDIHF